MFNSVNTKHTKIYLAAIVLSLLSFSLNAQESIKTQFQQALVEIEQQRYTEAELTLTRLLKKYPQLHRARAELARLQVKTAQWQKAQANIEILLALDNLPSPVRRDLTLLNITVEQELNRSKEQSRHQFEGSILASYGYDSDFALGNISEFLVDDIGADIDNLISGSIFFNEICNSDDISMPCDELLDSVAANEQEAVQFQQTGFINQNDEFISYLELFNDLDDRFGVDDSGDFIRNQGNFRHIYTADNNQYQWRNQVNYILDTPLDNRLAYKQLTRFDSELSWRLNDKWLASAQFYYNNFRRDAEDSFKYHGIQPELSYLSELGKWSVRADLYKKKITSFDGFEQNADYRSIAGSWSQHFEQQGILLSLSARYTDANSDQPISDFTSLGFSVKGLYNINQDWQLSAAINHTEFDFINSSLITVEQVSVKANYAFSEQWHGFLSWEYNRISDPDEFNSADRGTAQLGVKWQF